MNAPRQRPKCVEAVQWIKGHKGRDAFAPFTHQDMLAWRIFVHAVELWGYSDGAGRRGALDAMKGAVEAMQPKLRHMARDVIPCMLDWIHIIEIWPQIGSGVPILDGVSPKEHVAHLARGERSA